MKNQHTCVSFLLLCIKYSPNLQPYITLLVSERQTEHKWERLFLLHDVWGLSWKTWGLESSKPLFSHMPGSHCWFFSESLARAVRQAGTWDPLLQRCNACTWTHHSSSKKTQSTYMGLKITALRCSWGKFWTQKIQRDQKPNCHF